MYYIPATVQYFQIIRVSFKHLINKEITINRIVNRPIVAFSLRRPFGSRHIVEYRKNINYNPASISRVSQKKNTRSHNKAQQLPFTHRQKCMCAVRCTRNSYKLKSFRLLLYDIVFHVVYLHFCRIGLMSSASSVMSNICPLLGQKNLSALHTISIEFPNGCVLIVAV